MVVMPTSNQTAKDGQIVALVALAVHDANNTAIGIIRVFFHQGRRRPQRLAAM